ncbi:MAG: DUF2842 domain-containing protein [Exiguobacterium profundum]|nr:MAG: DUF2842 domain-containing protein [Exiguobacterium profundum]
MALAYRTRKRLAVLILLVGMPLYIVAAVTVVGLFDRPPFWVELLVYVGLGLVWIAPLRAIFRGIGQADPNAKKAEGQGPSA